MRKKKVQFKSGVKNRRGYYSELCFLWRDVAIVRGTEDDLQREIYLLGSVCKEYHVKLSEE